MTILIDSNIIIRFLKGDEMVVDFISDIITENTPIFISTISVYEVYLGIVANKYLKNGRPHVVNDLLKSYNQLLQTCSILNFTKDSAEFAADIYAQSQGKGITIKQNDCKIAGCALNYGISKIITCDEDDFKRIKQISGLDYMSFD